MYLQLICEILKLKSAVQNIYCETKRSKLVLSSLLLISIGAAFLTSARETQIVSINHAKVISSNLSGLEHSFWFCICEHNRGGEERFPREERRDAPASPFRCRWGLALIARRNVCDNSHTFAPKFGDVWRGYLRKSSPFTSFSLTFGKLTIEFEMLFQTKIQGCRTAALLAIYAW